MQIKSDVRRVLVGAAATALVTGTLGLVASPAHAAPTYDGEHGPSVSSTDFRVGQEIVGSIGDWTGDGTVSYTLEWKLCNPSYEYAECIQRATLTTTDATRTLAYTPTADDSTHAATAGGDHRRLIFSVTAADASGSTSWDIGRRVRADRLWESPRRSFFARGEPVNGSLRQRGHAAVAMAPDGTTTVIGYDLLPDGRYLLGADQLHPGGDRGPVEAIATVAGDAIPHILGAAADDTGRVLVSYHQGPGTALRVVERDPETGTWSAPRSLAQHDEVAGHGSLAADGDGHAVVWWVAKDVPDTEPEELRIATRQPDGSWTTHTVDQPLDDPCEGPARLESIREALVDIGPDGDVAAVWSRRHASCWDTHPPTYADTVMAAAYRTNGAWTEAQRIVRLPGYNGYRPRALDVSAAGAALAFQYTEHWDPNNSANNRENLYLLRTGPDDTFDAVDPSDPVAASPSTTLHRRSEGTSGIGFPQLSLNDTGRLAAAWEVFVTGGARSIEASYGSLNGGVTTEVVVSGHRHDVGHPDVVVAEDGTAALVTDRRGLWSIRQPDGTSWSPAQMLDLADQQWTLQPRSVANRAGDAVSFDADGRLWVAGAIGRDDRFFDVEWNHFGVTRLAPPGGGLYGEVAFAEAPVGRPIVLRTENVVSPGGEPVSYAWDVDDDGSFDDGTGEQLETTFDSAGVKTVTARLTTPNGDRAFAIGTVRIAENSAPYLHSVHRDPVQPVAGSPVTFSAVAYDDFDTPDQLTYAWWLDGTELVGETAATMSRSLTAGQHTVTARATDRDGGASDDSTITFTVEAAPSDPKTLDVEALGAGDGSVTSSPVGIDCPSDCTEDYEEGTTVTLTAEPEDGSTLSEWSGCDAVLTEGTQCRVAMTTDRDVSATFGLDDGPVMRRTLTVVRAGDGTGTVTGEDVTCGADCKGEFDDGTLTTLTATPAAGSVLTGWSGCESSSGTTCQVRMDTDKQVTATFGQQTVAVDTRITAQDLWQKKRKVQFQFDGSGGRGALSFECRLDDGKFKACTSPRSYRSLARGKHTFKVRAVDAYGVVDSTPAKAKFTVKRKA